MERKNFSHILKSIKHDSLNSVNEITEYLNLIHQILVNVNEQNVDRTESLEVKFSLIIQRFREIADKSSNAADHLENLWTYDKVKNELNIINVDVFLLPASVLLMQEGFMPSTFIDDYLNDFFIKVLKSNEDLMIKKGFLFKFNLIRPYEETVGKYGFRIPLEKRLSNYFKDKSPSSNLGIMLIPIGEKGTPSFLETYIYGDFMKAYKNRYIFVGVENSKMFHGTPYKRGEDRSIKNVDILFDYSNRDIRYSVGKGEDSFSFDDIEEGFKELANNLIRKNEQF
jgi:hypothetical protein